MMYSPETLHNIAIIAHIEHGKPTLFDCLLKQAEIFRENKINPIVDLNKIDKPHADPENALNKTFDLFVELGASDEQLDFSYCYASTIDPDEMIGGILCPKS